MMLVTRQNVSYTYTFLPCHPLNNKTIELEQNAFNNYNKREEDIGGRCENFRCLQPCSNIVDNSPANVHKENYYYKSCSRRGITGEYKGCQITFIDGYCYISTGYFSSQLFAL